MCSFVAALTVLMTLAPAADAAPGPATGDLPQECPAGGCDLSAVSPVCGVDGITYQTPCLAACQGVAIAKAGPCRAIHTTNFASAPAIGTQSVDGAITQEVMNRFKDEGFVFVGIGKGDPNFRPAEVRATGTRRRRVTKHNHAAVRFVLATGHMYATTSAGPASLRQMSASSKSEGFTVPFDPTATVPVNTAGMLNSTNITESSAAAVPVTPSASTLVQLGRKLRSIIAQDVLGADGRIRSTPTTSYPWNAVTLVNFNVPGTSGTYMCSGALVSPTSVLTAGHCVHGGKGGSWATNIRVSPGADDTARPYGTLDWEWATTYTEWMNNGCSGSCTVDRFYYDLAMIRLNAPIGATATGWLGMAASDVFSITATTAGYPGDKVWGTQWRQTCPVSDNNANDFLTSTNVCDIVGGQSGSGVWETSTNMIRAVVSHGSSVSNGFVTLTTNRFWDMVSWSGGLSTSWNDAGQWDTIFLDRHDLDCASTLRAMQSFKLETRYNPNRIRYSFGCTGVRSIGTTSTSYRTTPSDWGSGNTIYLDRHNVRCQPAGAAGGQVLQRWRLVRPSSTTIAIDYKCAPAPIIASSCENLATLWNAQGPAKGVNYLDRHAVACPGSKLLTGWQLQTNNAAAQMRIVYTCCGV